MPCISFIGSMSVYIYKKDHNPPHIHILTADTDTLFEIASGRFFEGDKLKGKQERKIKKWIKIHRTELTEMWDRGIFIKLEGLN